MNVLDCADIEAARWLNNNEYIGRSVDFARDNRFLLIAAGHRARRSHCALPGADVEFAYKTLGIFKNGFFVQNAIIRERLFVIVMDDKVLAQRKIEYKSVFLPILWNVTKPEVGSFLDREICYVYIS